MALPNVYNTGKWQYSNGVLKTIKAGMGNVAESAPDLATLFADTKKDICGIYNTLYYNENKTDICNGNPVAIPASAIIDDITYNHATITFPENEDGCYYNPSSHSSCKPTENMFNEDRDACACPCVLKPSVNNGTIKFTYCKWNCSNDGTCSCPILCSQRNQIMTVELSRE